MLSASILFERPLGFNAQNYRCTKISANMSRNFIAKNVSLHKNCLFQSLKLLSNEFLILFVIIQTLSTGSLNPAKN